MSLKFKQFFSVAALILMVWVGFNVSFSAGRVQVNEAKAVNLWGDYFDRTVGQKGFNDIGFGRNDPRVIVANVINIAFGFLGVLAIVLIMYGGFLWMTSAGDADKINTAKAILRNASIGLLIILSSFALAIFIISRLFFATTGLKTGIPPGGGGAGGALGALGAGIIKSVYPAPEQRDVPRNTSIIVTFREAIDPASICDKVTAGFCAADAKINAGNIHIYKTGTGDNKDTNLTEVRAFSNDNKTFVFSPIDYLGSPSEKIYYSVALTTGIKKANGQAAFSLSDFQWKFEISNKLDLTPPQVMSAGVFPAPDNAQDTVGGVQAAVQAQGAITVKRVPQIAVANSVAYVKTNNDPANPELNVPDPADNTCDGQIDVSINNTVPLSANVGYRNMPGKVNVPQSAILDRTIITACGFKIILSPGFAAGHSWRLTVASQKQADFLLVGSTRYTFTGAAPKANEIVVDNNLNNLANNIKTALASDANVAAQTNGAKVVLTARTAGVSGNAIVVLSSADYAVLAIDRLQGGADRQVTINVADKPDKPKNSTIQINFNEPINPLYVSGPAVNVANYIRVINTVDNSQVAGEFVVSNQYQTVEFVSANECGINGCGDKIYCLPANSHLRVELVAASLAATCATDADCVTRTPYNTCAGGICSDSKTNTAYPEGKPATGIMDLANNSLDGNRDTAAVGPASFFDENVKDVKKGDNYQWSFWISDKLDLAPPQILNTDASQGQSNVAVDKAVAVTFNKLMQSSSLSSGSVVVDNGVKQVTHQLLNLWSKSNEPVGYWVTKIDKDTNTPPTGEPNQTTAFINHSQFNLSTVYRSQAGSGLKDIYQNCFKPCASVNCQANQSAASCCNGVPTQLGAGAKCP